MCASESVASMAIGQPAAHRLRKKSVAQAKHAWLAAPLLDEGAVVRLIQRKGAKDREAAREVSHGLEGHLGRVGIPARRVDHGGVDTTFVHEAESFPGGERGDLAMGHVAGQSAAPEMDLSIHDAHHASPSLSRATSRSGLDNSNPRWRCPPLTLPGHPR